jgi:hypothetical protein
MLVLAATWLSWRFNETVSHSGKPADPGTARRRGGLDRSIATTQVLGRKDQFTSLLALSDYDLALRASELAGQGAGKSGKN